MYTPHTVTIYNLRENDLFEMESNITILRGVFLDISQGANIKNSGLENADSATLFVPFDVMAVDGYTETEKEYVTPKEYAALTSTDGYWTIATGGETSPVGCFFVKGEVVDASGYSALRQKYDHVFDVTTVDLRDFGSEGMQHWQVGGK